MLLCVTLATFPRSGRLAPTACAASEWWELLDKRRSQKSDKIAITLERLGNVPQLRSSPLKNLRDEQHLSDVLAVLDKVMGFGSLIETKGLRNPRLNGALTPQIQQLFRPSTHPIHLAPHVTLVDAEDTLVRIHQ